MTPSNTIKMPEEYTSAMQLLSAEATVNSPQKPGESKGYAAENSRDVANELRALGERLKSLEDGLTNKVEKLTAPSMELSQLLQTMDGHLTALRETETVNQKLFDSLHEELIKYRDNFLHESLQKPFIRDLMVLFDDLSGIASQIRIKADGRGGQIGLWRDNMENALHSVIEILHRLEVTEIEAKEKVDRNYHRVVSFEPTEFAEEEGQIVMRVKRGFLWRDRVLRPEEVVAKRFG